MSSVARTLLVPVLALCLCATPSFAAKKGKTPPPPKQNGQELVEQYTRLQIFLDNANFGPGKIDGHDGDFTRKALALYREAKGLPEPPPTKDPKAPPFVEGLDLAGIQPVFTEYEITKEDAATVGTLPSGPEAQSKVKSLPYATLAEAMAEKFHCDLDLFKKLNGAKAASLKAGDKVSVPNVKPFELSEVKSLQPGSEAAAAANEMEEPAESNAPAESSPAVEKSAPAEKPTSEPSTEKPPGEAATEKPVSDGAADKPATTAAEEKPKANTEPPAAAPKTDPEITVQVSTKDNVLKVFADQKIVAAFPVTIGSSETQSPVGEWKVRAVAKLPTFRYDKKMLQKGERSSDFKMLPPGPNNPVGVMWIALNKKGIGMHGTNDPDSIGRSASHGCIRLANWDVVKLATLVKAGVAVSIQ